MKKRYICVYYFYFRILKPTQNISELLLLYCEVTAKKKAESHQLNHHYFSGIAVSIFKVKHNVSQGFLFVFLTSNLMGIKKLDVKTQQLCSGSVKGNIKESLCGLKGEEPAEESPAQGTGWKCPNLAATGTPQTFKNRTRHRIYLFGLMHLPEWICLNPPGMSCNSEWMELSHLAELIPPLPDCNNYTFQGHTH